MDDIQIGIVVPKGCRCQHFPPDNDPKYYGPIYMIDKPGKAGGIKARKLVEYQKGEYSGPAMELEVLPGNEKQYVLSFDPELILKVVTDLIDNLADE